MQITFDHSEEVAKNIFSFYFKPDRPLQYTAGQYVQLTLEHDDPDNRGRKRWFTLSSSPTRPLLSITTRLSTEGSSSFKRSLGRLQKGDRLSISDPMGDFVLPKLVQTPLVFIAGGIGITPFKSILEWLADTGEERPIKLLYAVKTEDEIAFVEVFEAANQHATIVVANPSAAWGGERGRLNAEMILGLEEPSADTLFYISGPEKMVQALTTDLRANGVKREQLVADEFPGY